MCQRNEHFPYVSSPAKGNFVLEFPDRRQVWLPRMRQRVRRGEFEGLELCQL